MLTGFELGAGVAAAFTGRHGGVSTAPYDSLNLGDAVGDDAVAVRRNRERAAAELGVPAGRTVWLRQVHGTRVAYVTDVPGSAPAELTADATVTDVPGLALAVLVADCAPVLVADPIARVVGAAHSGRPGTAGGICSALVAEMCGRGARPDRMTAVIGPAVCGKCYEVPAGLRDEVAGVVPQAYAETRRGTPGLDIRAGVAAQLAAAGVPVVLRDPRCTMESPELFSYRRDGRTGRFAGYVWLTT